MANAAAKKAATARKQAQDIYLPVIFGLNGLYLFLKFVRNTWLSSVWYEGFWGAVFVATYYLLYQQILDQAMNRSPRDTSLVGGKWLDVLAVLAVIQLGSAAISTRFYWLLLVLPVWGAWSLYQTFMGKEGIVGGMTGGASNVAGNPTTAGTDPSGAGMANRKQRRSEQRQKR